MDELLPFEPVSSEEFPATNSPDYQASRDFMVSLYNEMGRDIVGHASQRLSEYHKTMLGLTASFSTLMGSIFAIAVVGANNVVLDSSQRAAYAFPICIMLSSTICFAIGAFPVNAKLYPDDPSEVHGFLVRTIARRRHWAIVGTILFVASIVSIVIGIARFNPT